MANPSKDKGTRFESAVVRYMREQLDDGHIERRALHGTQDKGDVGGIAAHGLDVIAECKCHRDVTPSLVARWRAETLRERENARAHAALLVVSVHRAPIGRSEVHVTLRDLSRIAGCLAASDDAAADRTWAVLTLEDACALMAD